MEAWWTLKTSRYYPRSRWTRRGYNTVKANAGQTLVSTNCLKRRISPIALSVALVGGLPLVAQQSSDRQSDREQEAKRPKIVLRAQPVISVTPARVVLTAELQGGSDDFEEYYCPAIEWEWGDDTSSESSVDCEPFEAGKSQIKRRYTVQHIFRREGVYKVYFHLKRNEKQLGSASATVQVRAGANGP